MAYVLGIDIGGSRITAAIARPWDNAWSQPEVFWLDAQSAAVSPVLHLAADGTLTMGDPARYGNPVDGGRIARDFVRRVGDPVPLLVGGESCTAPALTAVLASWVVEQVVAREGGHPEQIVLSHPSGWGAYRRGLLHAALWDIGLSDVTLLPAAVTAAESHATAGFAGQPATAGFAGQPATAGFAGQPATAGLAGQTATAGFAGQTATAGFAGQTLAVHALRDDGFTASVVGRTRSAAFTVLASADEVEPYGGAELDEALGNHVRAELGRQLGPRQLDDPQVRVALLGLTQECSRARERLTVATETDVRLYLPHGPIRVPVTRAEFTELIRPALQGTVDTLVATVRSGGLLPAQLDGVLLVGDWARTPLVAELIEARFPGLVSVQNDPEVTAAAGAALTAGQIARPTRRPPLPPELRRPNRALNRPDPALNRPDPALRPPGQALARPDSGSVGPDRGSPQSDPPPRPPVRITPLRLPKSRGSALRATGRNESTAGGRDQAGQRSGRSATRGHR
jgi:hypothetical protein